MFVCSCAALLYELKVPRWDFQTGRQLRTSPLYDRLDTQGARWMEKHGFERPKYFVPPGKGVTYEPTTNHFSLCCKEKKKIPKISGYSLLITLNFQIYSHWTRVKPSINQTGLTLLEQKWNAAKRLSVWSTCPLLPSLNWLWANILVIVPLYHFITLNIIYNVKILLPGIVENISN